MDHLQPDYGTGALHQQQRVYWAYLFGVYRCQEGMEVHNHGLWRDLLRWDIIPLLCFDRLGF